MIKQEAAKKATPLASYKVVNCCVRVNTALCGDQIYADFVRSLICED